MQKHIWSLIGLVLLVLVSVFAMGTPTAEARGEVEATMTSVPTQWRPIVEEGATAQAKKATATATARPTAVISVQVGPRMTMGNVCQACLKPAYYGLMRNQSWSQIVYVGETIYCNQLIARPTATPGPSPTVTATPTRVPPTATPTKTTAPATAVPATPTPKPTRSCTCLGDPGFSNWPAWLAYNACRTACQALQ